MEGGSGLKERKEGGRGREGRVMAQSLGAKGEEPTRSEAAENVERTADRRGALGGAGARRGPDQLTAQVGPGRPGRVQREQVVDDACGKCHFIHLLITF